MARRLRRNGSAVGNVYSGCWVAAGRARAGPESPVAAQSAALATCDLRLAVEVCSQSPFSPRPLAHT